MNVWTKFSNLKSNNIAHLSGANFEQKKGENG